MFHLAAGRSVEKKMRTRQNGGVSLSRPRCFASPPRGDGNRVHLFIFRLLSSPTQHVLQLLMYCVLNTILAGQCVPHVFAPPVSREAGLPPFPVKRPCLCPTTIPSWLFSFSCKVGEFIVSFGRSEYQTPTRRCAQKLSRRTGGVRGCVWRVSPENHERDVTSSRAAGSKF